MKSALLGLASLTVLVTLSACAKEPAQPANNPQSRKQQGPQNAESPKPIDPSQIVVVETAERKERLGIESEAAADLAAKDFTKLENLANKYRTSKACYPSGSWKLASVYSGMFPRRDKADTEWQTNLNGLRGWTQIKPDSITARVGLADALVAYAWKARGEGLANTVTETGWKLFEQRLSEAVQVLKQAETLDQKCPRYWSVLMTAALGLGANKSQYEALYQKAIQSEPDCVDYHFRMAYYLLPRWHGKRGEVAAFVQKTASQIGGDAGDLFYARVAWFLQGSGGNVFDEDGLSWERADKGFQLLEKQFPDSLYVQNERAYIAVMGCEKTLAPRRLVDGLHGKIDTTAWTSKENFIRLTRDLYPR